MSPNNQLLDIVPSLAHLKLKTDYRSDTDDLLRDLYLPCLRCSTLYRRAVGYFTSRGLAVAAQGITALIDRGGRMQLVASPLFDADDLAAIEQGYAAREDVIAHSLLRQIKSSSDTRVEDHLGYLAWLVAEDRLEVRIAVPHHADGRLLQGIYHEKLGLFSDNNSNVVAFTGSPNETSGGLVDNFESTDVFCSWADPESRVERKIAHFESLWNDETPRLAVRPFPEAARDHLLRYRPRARPQTESSLWIPHAAATRPLPDNLWDHQVEAIQAWENHGRRGLLSMATGSGKTRVALVAAERCPDLGLLVIAVPRKGLVEQWRHELERKTTFRSPILVYEGAARWQESLFNHLRTARWESTGPVIVIGTLHSLSGKRFASVLQDCDYKGHALLVADEVHNAGAPALQAALRPIFDWRLGLSATPARHFDEVGTEVLRRYFRSTVYTYEMRRALEDGRLCPYRYYVCPAHLTEDEYEEYERLTRQIISLRGSRNEGLTYRTDNRIDSDGKAVERLLFRRALILKKCSAKLKVLDAVLDEHPMQRGLIYCADGEQLGGVVEVLRRRVQLHLTYTAETPGYRRRSALDSLQRGFVPIIAAIDCLDEGVDVPTVDEAIILASSQNKRQFVQRRGRILRIAPGKSFAKLVDIIALPPLAAGRDARRMLHGELSRIKDMAELALNKYDALRAVKMCAEPYGVFLTELLSGEGDG